MKKNQPLVPLPDRPFIQNDEVDEVYDYVLALAAATKKKHKRKPWECEACYERRIDYIMSSAT